MVAPQLPHIPILIQFELHQNFSLANATVTGLMFARAMTHTNLIEHVFVFTLKSK